MSHDEFLNDKSDHAAKEIQKLVYMANQITVFFASRPDDEAIASVADHIRKFWDPRMRIKIIAHLAAGGEGLSNRARAAIDSLPKQTATT